MLGEVFDAKGFLFLLVPGDVASDVQAQFVIISAYSVQNVAVSTIFVVSVCKIHQNKGLETSF